MELKRRKVRRGAKRYLEHHIDGRPVTGYFPRGIPDYDHDAALAGLDQTPPKPFDRDEFLASLNLGESPSNHLRPPPRR